MDLAGQISLSLDAHLDRSTLAVRTWRPTALPLPQHRLGLEMDRCGVREATNREQGALRPASVSATCGGESVALVQHTTGAWSAELQPALPVGTTCRVRIDGETLELPALLPWPDLRPTLLGLAWPAGDADELRVVVPLPSGDLSSCRLADDGRGPSPRQLRRHTAFATRQSYALHQTEAGTIAVTVASGTWLRRGRATTSR